MRLQDVHLDGWGRFNEAPASFVVTEFGLRRPWDYIYTSDDILLRLSHNGCGYSQVDPPGGIMLVGPTRYETKPLFLVWILEEGQPAFSNFFNPYVASDPLAKPDDYSCLFNPESAHYEGSQRDLFVTTDISIAVDSPSIIMRVRIRNNGARRSLTLCPVWRPHNGKADLALWDVLELYQSCKFFNNHGTGIMVETRDPDAKLKNRKYTAMLTDLDVDAAELRYRDFVGGGSFENPELLGSDTWWIRNDKDYNLEDFRGADAVIAQLPVAAMKGKKLTLEKGQDLEFTVVLHHVRECEINRLAPAMDNAAEMLSQEYWERTLQSHKDFHADWRGKFSVQTPDAALNSYINEWLPLQLYWVSKLDRGWPTGMRGTRDAAQDYSGISYFDPVLGGKMLEAILACQRQDGSFPRQISVQGPGGKHDLRDYVDSGCWVFELFCDYIALSGDREFLSKSIRWLDSEQVSTVETHVKRLLDYYLSPDNRSIHGLVKIKGGDWNDALNNSGLLGVGESVMVSCHVIHLLKLGMDIFAADESTCLRYKAEAEQLRANIRKHALNQAGFLNGIYTDNSQWLFSDNDPDHVERVNSPVNSFGLIAGVFDKAEFPEILKKIDSLKGPNGYRLFYPPFGAERVEMAGRMGSGDLYAGTCENGTVYNHGSQGFLIRALAAIGEGERALDVLRHVLPYDQTLHPVRVCKSEPYGILNCWSEVHGREGEGERSFLSGTISTVFRAFYNGILGFKPQPGGLKIEPCLPDSWATVTYSCSFRGRLLEIRVDREAGISCPLVYINGRLSTGLILESELMSAGTNQIHVRISSVKESK